MKYIIKYVKKLDQLLVGMTMKFIPLRYGTNRVIHPKHLFDDDRNIYLKEVIKTRKLQGFEFLDLGCGSGSDLILAAKSGAKNVYGIEYSENSRLVARQRLDRIGANYRLFDHNLEDASLPFTDQSVDLINFTNVLEHLNNRKQVLDEIYRVLTDAGIIVVSIPNKDTPWKKMQRRYGLDSRDDEDHKVEYSKEMIKSELLASGLKIITPFDVIVPSLPIHGLLCLLSLLGPRPYLAGQNFKRRFVRDNPEHTIGWIFLAQKIIE
jgi:SAM-dependent methyltransferase